MRSFDPFGSAFSTTPSRSFTASTTATVFWPDCLRSDKRRSATPSSDEKLGVLGVVVCGDGRRAVGIVNERTLQFVGNHAENVAIHFGQRVHARFHAHAIRRGAEDAVSHEAHLVSAGHDPLRIGGGEM